MIIRNAMQINCARCAVGKLAFTFGTIILVSVSSIDKLEEILISKYKNLEELNVAE